MDEGAGGLSGTSELALCFEAVDADRVPAVTEVIRLLPVLVEGRLSSCDAGADPATRRVRVLARAKELGPGALGRVAFWAARAGGLALPVGSARSDHLEAIGRCARVVHEADPLRVLAAIRTAFPPPRGAPALAPMAGFTPTLSLNLHRAALEGMNYDPVRRTLFVPSPLAPAVGDDLVVQLGAPGLRGGPARAPARVVDACAPGEAATGRPAGFRVQLAGSDPAHALLVERCPGPLGAERRRAAQRHRVAGPVRVHAPGPSGERRTGSFADLSFSGAFVRMPRPCAVGDRVVLEAVLPDGVRVSTEASVVSACADGMSVRFEPGGAPPALAATIAGLGGRSPRVLLVGGEVGARSLLEDELRERGYGVATAPDAASALRLLTERLLVLDLLVVDAAAGEVGGEELAAAIRWSVGERDLPVLLAGAHALAPPRARRRAPGEDERVAKATGPGAIADLADEILASRSDPGRAPGPGGAESGARLA